MLSIVAVPIYIPTGRIGVFLFSTPSQHILFADLLMIATMIGHFVFVSFSLNKQKQKHIYYNTKLHLPRRRVILAFSQGVE